MFFSQFEQLCQKNNISPTAVVQKLGMSKGTITNWKNGVIPNGETIIRLAEYFNVSTDYLLMGKLHSSDLCLEEIELLQRFRTLPDLGKEKVKSYMDGYIACAETEFPIIQRNV